MEDLLKKIKTDLSSQFANVAYIAMAQEYYFPIEDLVPAETSKPNTSKDEHDQTTSSTKRSAVNNQHSRQFRWFRRCP